MFKNYVNLSLVQKYKITSQKLSKNNIHFNNDNKKIDVGHNNLKSKKDRVLIIKI